jgi:2'-5' RNA ligase
VVLAVELLFDDDSDRRLRKLWDRLEQSGVPTLRDFTHRRHRPHLSYTVLEEWDHEKVRDALEAQPLRPPLTLSLQTVGTFPGGVAWLGPIPTEELLSRHRMVDAAVQGAGAVVRDHYRPNAWLPHCTLSMETRLEHQSALYAAAHAVLPMAARVVAAGLVDSRNGAVWPLTHVP